MPVKLRKPGSRKARGPNKAKLAGFDHLRLHWQNDHIVETRMVTINRHSNRTRKCLPRELLTLRRMVARTDEGITYVLEAPPAMHKWSAYQVDREGKRNLLIAFYFRTAKEAAIEVERHHFARHQRSFGQRDELTWRV